MSRRHAGSLEPDDEVMPYSDDETDDELDASTEEEEEEPPGAPQPPAEPQVSGETQPYANDGFILYCEPDVWQTCMSEVYIYAIMKRRTSFSEMAWKVKANDRPYHHLPEFQKKVFLCIKKSRYSVRWLQCKTIFRVILEGFTLHSGTDHFLSIRVSWHKLGRTFFSLFLW